MQAAIRSIRNGRNYGNRCHFCAGGKTVLYKQCYALDSLRLLNEVTIHNANGTIIREKQMEDRFPPARE
jgi:hypothetical protein